MLEQLYRYTHENINSLSARKVFSAVLAIYFTVWFNNYWFFDNLKRYIFGVPLFWGRLWFYTGCDLNYLSNIHLLKAAIIF